MPADFPSVSADIESVIVSGSLTATGESVEVDCTSRGTVCIQLYTSWAGTVIFEGINGIAPGWEQVYAFDSDGSTNTQSSVAGTFFISCAGLTKVRARATGWTAGICNVVLTASPFTAAVFVNGIATIRGDAAVNNVTSTSDRVFTSGLVTETPDDAAPNLSLTADSRFIRAIGDRYGVGYVHPHGPWIWHASNEFSAAQTDTILRAAPGLGLSIYLTDIFVAAAGAVTITLKQGTNVLKWKVYLPANGEAKDQLRTPIKLSPNTEIRVDTSAAVAHTIVISGFVAP